MDKELTNPPSEWGRNRDAENRGQTARSSLQLTKLLAALPIPVLFLLLGVFIVWNIRGVFEPPWLLPLLNTVFLSAIPFIIAYITTRGYLISGSIGLLMLTCGVLTIGLSSFLSGIIAIPDTNVTIYNCGVLLAAVFHLTGATFILIGIEPQLNPRSRKINVIKGYLIESVTRSHKEANRCRFTTYGKMVSGLKIGVEVWPLISRGVLLFPNGTKQFFYRIFREIREWTTGHLASR